MGDSPFTMWGHNLNLISVAFIEALILPLKRVSS